MNLSSAVIGAVASIFVAILGIILKTWVQRNDDAVKRNDQAVKLSREAVTSAAKDMAVFNALRGDLWDLQSWARRVKDRWNTMQDQLTRGPLTQLLPLPPDPESRLAELDRQAEEDDGD